MTPPSCHGGRAGRVSAAECVTQGNHNSGRLPLGAGPVKDFIVLNRGGNTGGCPAPGRGAGGPCLHRWRAPGDGSFRVLDGAFQVLDGEGSEAQPSAGSSRASATAKIFIPASSKRITTSSPARVMVLFRMVPVPYLGCRTRIPSE